MTRIPDDAMDVQRWVARVYMVGGKRPHRTLSLRMWADCDVTEAMFVERRSADRSLGDMWADVAETFGVTTFRGHVAKVGAPVEVVTFTLNATPRLIVAPLRHAPKFAAPPKRV